jgi:pantoate kinase
MKVTAFCPGHLTGFFFPCEHDDPLHSGSRGAGLCVNLGATSQVEVKKGNGAITIFVNGQMLEAPVTRSAIEYLLGNRALDIVVETKLQLPMSAGFGMSAAGALSAAFALTKAAARDEREAFEAAHRAELKNRTGLGDVAALTAGGLTFRRREGLPPYGRIDRLAERLDIVAAVVGEGMRTSSILNNPELKERIREAGERSYSSLDNDPTIDNFFRASREFTERSGLASPKVMETLKEIDAHGQGSMVMLGNSVFATGDLDAIEKVLRRYGQTFRLSLEPEGPRVIDIKY